MTKSNQWRFHRCSFADRIDAAPWMLGVAACGKRLSVKRHMFAGHDVWQTLPAAAQCTRCRKYASNCASQEQVLAVETALHLIAQVFA